MALQLMPNCLPASRVTSATRTRRLTWTTSRTVTFIVTSSLGPTYCLAAVASLCASAGLATSPDMMMPLGAPVTRMSAPGTSCRSVSVSPSLPRPTVIA